MSGKDLFEGMSYVDERFVDEAENESLPKRKVSPWIKVVSMAACLCLIIFSLYNLQSHSQGKTEGITGEQTADAMPLGTIENEPDMKSFKYPFVFPGNGQAARAPELMVRIQKVTESGFVGMVENMSGFVVFEDGTEITVTIDLETDPDFCPDSYKIGDLVHVMYTDWDEEARTIVASILGIVDEPICD